MMSLRKIFKTVAAPLFVAGAMAMPSDAYGANTQQDVQREAAPAAAVIQQNQNTAQTSAASLPLSSSANATSASISSFHVGGVTFAAPWVLLGLGTLPAIWFLLQSMPRKPTVQALPTIKLLKDLKVEEQESEHMPWWQKTMRICIAGMAITAMAGPHFAPEIPLEGSGPVVLVIDNDWASAQDWPDRVKEYKAVITQAQKSGQKIYMLSTSPLQDDIPLSLTEALSAEDALKRIENMKANSWMNDREGSISALTQFNENNQTNKSVFWFSNGLKDSDTSDFLDALQTLGPTSVYAPDIQDDKNNRYVLMPPNAADTDLVLNITRANTQSTDTQLSITASDQAGNTLARSTAVFSGQEKQTSVFFDIMPDVRRKISRISIDGQNHAGAVVLMDEQFRNRPVGILQTSQQNSSRKVQSLLDETTYVEKSLDEHVDTRTGNLTDLLHRPLAVMVATDGVILTEDDQKSLKDWVQKGGTLLRFAGPNMAAQSGDKDTLLPVTIREDDRFSSGAIQADNLATKSRSLMPFEPGSPFYGIALKQDIKVDYSIRIQPDINTEERTWASLDDGTPFVTATRQGNGWVVLVHTTADTNWSNLPLSGLFVDMMTAIVDHSNGVLSQGKDLDTAQSLPPLQVLNGLGQLTSEIDNAKPLSYSDIELGTINAAHPPGLYGSDNIRYAHNLSAGLSSLEMIDKLPDNVTQKYIESGNDKVDMKGPLLAAMLLLAMIDMGVVLGQNGCLTPYRKKKTSPKLPGLQS